MEQLQNFSVDFLSRSVSNTLGAEEYYNEVLKALELEFLQPYVAVNDTAQKTKKHKQAAETSAARKGVPAAGPDGGNNKENVDRSNAMESEESPNAMDATTTSETNQRPVRARKTKLANLRESLITGEKLVRIKKEPVDKPTVKPKPSIAAVVVIPETPVAEKRKSSNDESNGAANLSTESSKKLDDSVELIAKKPELVEVSDDEAEMMPPPALPVAKTRKPRTKKQSAAAPAKDSVKVKQEPVEEMIPKRSTRSKAVKKPTPAKEPVAEPEAEDTFENIVPKIRNSSLANASTLSTETSVTTQQQQPSSQPITEPEKTRSKARTKSKKPVIDKVTKQVIPEPEPVVEAEPEPTPVPEKRKSSPPAAKPSKGPKKNAAKKQSTDSVYEDAKSDSKLFSSQVFLEDIQKPPSSEEKEDSTVVAALTAPALPEPVQPEVEVEASNVNNETFVTTTTPVVLAHAKPKAKAAAEIPAAPSPHLDSTFNVAAPAPTNAKKNSVPRDSIMTEDLSMAVKQEPLQSPPRKPRVAPNKPASAKKAHEIFNPFVQSPVKAKVDAYERHAKESKIPVTPKYVHVPRLPVIVASQPLPMRSRDNDTTPLKSGGGLLGSTASDTTGNRLAHMKKVLGKGALSGASSTDSARGSSSTVSSSSAKSLHRSASAEDAKRMANALQLAADEKKRKREEKQRLAQLNREKMEKDKKEQLDRLAKEREEKAKKFLLEKAEQAKQEKKKQAMARLAMENSQQMKIKELQMRQKAALADSNGNGWDLLRSEDSTDDEDSQNKNLPPPPSWSRDPLRTRLANQQANIPSNMIDTMFGLKPMSPDLREIFPDIDPKLLKRNSSMIWKTPPRFSRIERP